MRIGPRRRAAVEEKILQGIFIVWREIGKN